MSSLDVDGRSSVCPGDLVVYTCSIANTGVLQWAVESFHRIEDDPILFTAQYHPVGTVVHVQGGFIVAEVTESIPIMVYWGNITSTLTVMTQESFTNKRIWCSNGGLHEVESPCIIHNTAG